MIKLAADEMCVSRRNPFIPRSLFTGRLRLPFHFPERVPVSDDFRPFVIPGNNLAVTFDGWDGALFLFFHGRGVLEASLCLYVTAHHRRSG